ncbi:MAG: DUF1501 domain-containing protein [Planctomycetaceae bacterium]
MTAEIQRRAFLNQTACVLGGTLLADASPRLSAEEFRAPDSDPLTAKSCHRPARAKRVIFLYMTGGVSHVDSFDPRPELFARHGQQITVDNWQETRPVHSISETTELDISSRWSVWNGSQRSVSLRADCRR